jgi:amino acid permease
MRRVLPFLLILIFIIFGVRNTHTQTANPHGVLLTWTAPSGTVTGYNVFRAVSASGACGAYAQVGTVSGTATTYNDPASGLALSTSYCYEVQTVDGVEVSGPSNTATVTTPSAWPANPSPPSGCTAAVE